ncbi:MAG TPA: hypothetical protein PKN45_10510 [Candidatus Limiplasma sp.]|nr:hypothetical protein [Candidatus Limiplasma sp.]
MKKLLSFALVLALALVALIPALAEDSADVAAVKARGKLLVGVKADVPNFGYQDLGGEFEGLEIDLAHKLAEVILGDPNAVEFTAVTAKNPRPAAGYRGVGYGHRDLHHQTGPDFTV